MTNTQTENRSNEKILVLVISTDANSNRDIAKINDKTLIIIFNIRLLFFKALSIRIKIYRPNNGQKLLNEVKTAGCKFSRLIALLAAFEPYLRINNSNIIFHINNGFRIIVAIWKINIWGVL